MPDSTPEVTWEAFSAVIAEIAEVEQSSITEATRIVGDLNLASLGIAELITVLLVDYQVYTLLTGPQTDDIQRITAGDVFEHIREFRPPKWKVSAAPTDSASNSV